MKKNFAIGSFIFGLMFIASSTTLAQSQTKLGGALAYGSEVEAIGVQVGMLHGITEEIDISADVTIFFPDNYDWWTINANAHYKLVAEEGVDVYGLAGLNYTTWELDLGQAGSSSGSEAGLNVGGGAEFNLDFANLFGELKYIIGDADQLVINAGLRFSI